MYVCMYVCMYTYTHTYTHTHTHTHGQAGRQAGRQAGTHTHKMGQSRIMDSKQTWALLKLRSKLGSNVVKYVVKCMASTNCHAPAPL
jgi:hypothetical protein